MLEFHGGESPKEEHMRTSRNMKIAALIALLLTTAGFSGVLFGAYIASHTIAHISFAVLISGIGAFAGAAVYDSLFAWPAQKRYLRSMRIN